MVKDTGGYTFAITGYVYDATNAPAMMNGAPAVGIIVHTIGPKIITTQTRTNGSYTLSFTNAPVGTYDVCVTLPTGYTMNPPSGCERVTVRLSEKYDATLELENNGHIALKGIGINFSIMRQQTQNMPSSTDEPPLKLKGVGVNFEDFVFTKAKLQFNRLFMGFGFIIPGSSSSSGQDKSNPQPTYIVPLGTPVRSIVDEIVVAIPTLWSGDVSIQVTADGKMQKWIYETEHLINPKVAVGDKVVAGQIIGEVSSFGNGNPPEYGAVEIGLLKGGQTPEHVCPFAYLDDSIQEDTFAKIKNLFQSWEEYAGDQTLYTDTEIPGCLTLHPIEG